MYRGVFIDKAGAGQNRNIGEGGKVCGEIFKVKSFNRTYKNMSYYILFKA